MSYKDDIPAWKKFAEENPDIVDFVDPRELFSTERKIKPILYTAIKGINKTTTKLSDFDRWLRKTLNEKGRNFEVGSLYKGSPFRVVNEFPYTKATNWNMLQYPDKNDWFSYWGGLTSKNILPTDAWNYNNYGILPVENNNIIPTQIPFK
jgi:hypothetical protein